MAGLASFDFALAPKAEIASAKDIFGNFTLPPSGHFKRRTSGT